MRLLIQAGILKLKLEHLDVVGAEKSTFTRCIVLHEMAPAETVSTLKDLLSSFFALFISNLQSCVAISSVV